MEIFIVCVVFILLEQKILQKHENVCKDHNYCYVEMPGKYNIKILNNIK